jgi:effector-binding domain-containing protein
MERVLAAERPTAVIVETTTWEAFPALGPRLLDEVRSVAAGRNVMLYRDATPVVEVGVLASGFTPHGRVVASALPAGTVARTVHRGPYAGLGAAHRAVLEWCAGHGHVPTGMRWEVYGPHRDDPAQLETEICWQLRA